MTAVLSRYERNHEKIVEKFDHYNNIMLLENRELFEQSNKEIEKLERGSKISINKNKQEIKKFQDEAEESIRNLKNEVATSKKVYLESIELANTKSIREITDAETIYNDEIKAIDTELKALRDEYRIIIRKTEAERTKVLDGINNEFSTIKNDVEENISKIRSKSDNENNILKIDYEEHKKDTDETYLTIKRSHTQTSVKFNEFINNHKKTNQLKIKNHQNEYEKNLKPFELEKQHLKQEYEENLATIQNQYSNQVQTLNIMFDLQKAEYNKKTGEIITKNSDDKTTENAKFSSLMDSLEESKKIQKDKQIKALLKKDISEREKDSINREYQVHIKQLNNNITKAIKENKKIISNLEIKLQEQLFDHDSNHIIQMNDWRYNKNVYDNSYNKALLKAKNSYELKLKQIKLNENLLKLHLNDNTSIENIKLKKDLLPIEAQLFLSSLVQEREINLLNTEDETTQNIFNLKQSILSNKFFLDELALRHELALATEEKRFKDALTRIKFQLQLEQLKLKRDHELYTLNLNKELQLSLLNQKTNIETIKKDTAVYEANLNINNLEARIVYDTKHYRKNALIELEKRQTIIHEIKIKTQRQELNNKINRIIEIAKNEANLHERINHNLFDEILNIYSIINEITNITKKLFTLPAHPETFRQFLSVITILFKHYKDEIDYLVKEYIEIDNDLFNRRIANMTEHKYRLKHEEIINLYQNNIDQIEAKIKELLKQHDDLNSQLVLIQKKEALNLSIIDNYLNINKNNKGRKQRSLIRYNKIQIKVLNDEIDLLRHNYRENRKELLRLSNKIIPLNKQIDKLVNRQKKAENKLAKQRNKEEFRYIKLQKNHLNQYINFIELIDKKKTNLITNFNILINKPYLSNEFFISKYNRIEKQLLDFNNMIIYNQQLLLNNWLSLFTITENDQIKIYNNFEKSTNFAIDRLRKTHYKFLKTEEKEKVHFSKNYLSETKRNSDLIIKANETKQQSIKTYQTTYRDSYKYTEDKIFTRNEKNIKQSAIITENLKGVNEDLTKEHQTNLVKLEKSFKNEHNNLKVKLENQNKALKDIDRRNILRTEAIIDRYEKQKEREMRILNTNANKHSEEIKNLEQNKINEVNKMDNKIKFLIKDNKNVEKLIDNEISKFKITTRKEQNKIIKKEHTTLKNSYKFKRKQIKI